MDYPDIQPMIDGINTAAGIVVSAICLAGLILLVAWYTLGRVRHYRKTDSRGGLAKGLFLGLLATVEAGFLVLIVGFLPGFLTDPGTENAFPNSAFIRWFLLYLTIPLITYLLTRKHSGLRGLVSTTLLLSIALFGWFYEKWIGILLISIPIYLLLAHLLYHMAQIILPASDPEDRKESRKKFFALLYFTLGLQYPFWSAGSRVARETEKRISGDYFNGLFEPGTVWTHSHQVVGISAGIEFHQVEGPGIVFTRTYDRPGAVIDLRTQLRTVDFEATTKDGIPIRPALFISFCLDKEDWPKKGWKREDFKHLEEDCKANPILQKALRLDRRVGIHSYSTARVKSVLSTVGNKPNTPEPGSDRTVHWDEWVIMQAENCARQALSQRKLDELWRPLENQSGASALDEIATRIRYILEPRLRRIGIHLYAARVVNYKFQEDSQVRKQQIESWKALWNQRISAAKAESQATFKEEVEKAHAYAKSALLDTIADSIAKARKEHDDLPRHVIALYYLHVIEESIKKQGGLDKDSQERVALMKQYLGFNM